MRLEDRTPHAIMYEDEKRHPRVGQKNWPARGFFCLRGIRMKSKPFGRKPFLKITVAALLLCGGASQLYAQTIATLEEVVVTASRAEESRREVSSNVTVISNEKIQASTAGTLDQLMEQNGFQVINQGSQKIMFIRGMGQPSLGTELQSRVLVLVNGRRIGANNVAMMGIDKDGIERIEIVRGPTAVQYGSSAMGGVVNIITKKGKDGFRGSFEAGIGSDDLHKESLSLNGGGGGFDASFGLTQFGRDAYTVSGGDKWAHTGIGSSLSMNTDFGYTFAEFNRVGLNFNFYRQDDVESPDSGMSSTGPSGTTYNIYDLGNRNLAFMYDGATSEKFFDWAARYSFGRDRQESDPSHSSWGGTPGVRYLDNKLFTARAGINGDIFSLDWGIDYLKYELDDEGDKSDSSDTGVYFSGRLRLLDERFIISAGGRYDNFSVGDASGNTKDSNFAPSVGAAVLPAEWLKLRVNYAAGFRMPAPVEYTGGAWYESNKELVPEKSKTVEFGSDVNYKSFDAGATWFHTNWDDKIYAKEVATWVWQFVNLKKSVISGLEFTAGEDIGNAAGWNFKLRPYFSLTLLTERKNGDDDEVADVGSKILPNTPRATLTYGIDLRHNANDFAVNANAVYFSDILTRDRRSGSPTYYDYIHYGSGTVFNMSVEKGIYKWKENGGLKLRAEINNVFDAANMPYIDYPGPGRNFYFGLRCNFD